MQDKRKRIYPVYDRILDTMYISSPSDHVHFYCCIYLLFLNDAKYTYEKKLHTYIYNKRITYTIKEKNINTQISLEINNVLSFVFNLFFL